MDTSKTPTDPATKAPPMMEEADIGSGEKSPGHAETEEMIRQIPALPASGPGNTAPDGDAAGYAGHGGADPERAPAGNDTERAPGEGGAPAPADPARQGA